MAQSGEIDEAAVWARPSAEVVDTLGTDADLGLTSTRATERLDRHGPNQIPTAPPESSWRRLLRQGKDPVVYLLLAATMISLIVWLAEGRRGAPFDAIVIAVIVLANAAIGFAQEVKAERAVAALADLTRTETTVVRDGRPQTIDATQLVPGDVVTLSDGDLVPADARLLHVSAARAAEAALTGESSPVIKSIEPVESEAGIGDRTSMLYGGTALVSGRARAVVTATGLGSEVGRIAKLLEDTEKQPTPLQVEIDRVGRMLGVAVLVIAVVVVATLIVVEDLRTLAELTTALLIGVSLAVAAVPEGLPAVLSLVLALGVQRMADNNALVKRLASVETLGSATIICSDKTGTLTRNEMTLRRLVVASGQIDVSGAGYDPDGTLTRDGAGVDDDVLDEARWALISGGLASDASVDLLDGRFRPIGDPTEAAIVAALPKAGVEPPDLARRFVRTDEIPFSSERKRMTTIQVDHDDDDRLVLTSKGAPEVILPRCRYEYRQGAITELLPERHRWWADQIDGLAAAALRTLAMAYRPCPEDLAEEPDENERENELVLVGVAGIIDPPREEARQAVQLANDAGVRVAMITGDHPATAARIAAELGIADAGSAVVSGAELAVADDRELREIVTRTSVYARVSPEHKLRIVKALAANDEIVAMTGDGVNDAPALKAADIGVAMGITGTDVSKEAADMILTDDNFATIVVAVSEGRAIFHNIRSFLRYLLSSNIGEVLTVFLGVIGAGLIGLSTNAADEVAAPLLAVQILWINLVTDAAPALALGIDPPDRGLMDRSPRKPDDSVIDRRMQVGIGVVGLTMAVASLTMLDLRLAGGLLGGSADLETARTGAFTVLVMAQLFNTFNARSDTESIRGRLTSNRWLLAAIALSLLLQVAVVNLPVLNDAFGTTPLPVVDWLIAAALASSVVVVSELRKWLLRRQTPRAELD